MLKILKDFFNGLPKTQIVVSVAILSGILWRIYLVDKFILWGEELWVYFFSTQPKTYLEHLFFPVDDRPPLYYLLIKFLTIFSKEELVLRLPSFISGSLLLISITKFVWQRQKKWAAIIAFFGINYYFFVTTSTQSRDYGLLILMAWWQFSIAWKWLEKLAFGLKSEDLKLKNWWQWAVAASLGVGLNYAYIPFLGSLWLSLIIYIFFFKLKPKQKKYLKDWLIRYIFSMFPAGLIAVYYLYMAGQMKLLLQTTDYILKPKSIDVINLFINLFGIGVSQKNYLDPSVFLSQTSMLMFGFSLLVIGWVLAWKKTKFKHFIFLAGSTFLLNLGVILLVSFFSENSFFLTRFFVPVSVVCFLLMTLSIYQMWLFMTPKIKPFFVIFLILVYFPIYLSQLNQREFIFGDLFEVRKENRRLIKTVRSFLHPGDQLVILPKTTSSIYWSYYFESQNYKQNRLLSKRLNPLYIDSCFMPSEVKFEPGAKLILVLIGEVAKEEIQSIKLSESASLYPKTELPLADLCVAQPRLVVRMLNSAIWDCNLKTTQKINYYTFAN